MGMDPVTLGLLGGSAISGISNIFGAHSQQQTNQNNLNAQQQQQQMMQQQVGQYMSPAGQQNPYAQQMMQFLGMQAPQQQMGASQGFGQMPQGQYGGHPSYMSGPQYGTPAAGNEGTQEANTFVPAQEGDMPMDGGDAQLGAPISNRSMGSMGRLGGLQLNPGSAQFQDGARSSFGSVELANPNQSATQDSVVQYTGGMMNSQMQPGQLSLPNWARQPQAQQQSGQAYQFQPQGNGAFNYNPAQLGGAPQVSAPQMGGLPQLGTQQIGAAPQFNAPMLGGGAQMQAAQAGGPQQVNAPEIGGLPTLSAQQIQMPGAVGTQGFNAGQDGLMQMMNRNISLTRDSSIDPMLQSGMGQFDNTQLFKALAPQDQQLLDEQVNQLHGSAGSFGQRFGSAMMKQEAGMRGQFANNVAARNAGIQQQSFESASGRALQGAGIQAGREAQFAQAPFQNAQMQLQAAGQLGGLAQQGQALGLQAQQFNVGQQQNAQQFNASNQLQADQANLQARLQAQQGNQQAGVQTGIANQQAGLQAQLANAGYQQQAGQFNAGQQQQAQLANQQAGLQAGMQNQQMTYAQQLAQAQMAQQAGQFNIGNQFGMMQGNQQAAMQALLANQGLMGQYGLANQQAMNQAGQFNAGMNMQNQQFNAQQGNIYNQLMMSGMMNAGQLQAQQQGQNASLLGILGGIGVPQQQVNPMYGAIGNLGQTMGTMPMIMSLLGGGGGGGGNSGYAPSNQPNFSMPSNLGSLYGTR